MTEPVLYVKNGNCSLTGEEAEERLSDIADGYGVGLAYEESPSEVDMGLYDSPHWGVGLVLPAEGEEGSSGIQVHPVEETYSAQVDPAVSDIAADMKEIDQIISALGGSQEPWREKHVPDEEEPWLREPEYTTVIPSLLE